MLLLMDESFLISGLKIIENINDNIQNIATSQDDDYTAGFPVDYPCKDDSKKFK